MSQRLLSFSFHVQHPSGCCCQFLFREGFHEEFSDPDLSRLLLRDCLAVACTEDDRNVRPYLEKFGGKLRSCHSWHGMIGNHQIKDGRIGGEGFQGLRAVTHSGYPVAETLEGHPTPFDEHLFIIDEEDPFRAAGDVGGTCRLSFLPRSLTWE